MKLTFRAVDRIRLVVIPDPSSYVDVLANDPHTFTPLEIRSATQRFDRGLLDVPLFYRGDTVTIEATLLDYRGNAFPNLATAVGIELSAKKLVPTVAVLFTVTGTLVDALLGRVDFALTASETNQLSVDEAIGNVRVEKTDGDFVTFETFPISFRDSSFT